DVKLFKPTYLLPTLAGFMLWCLIAGSVYIINDLAGAEKDRLHPKKRHRPIPSGQLSRNTALVAAVLIPLVILPLAALFDPFFGAILASYFVLQIAYSFWLKQVVILDVMIIAAGYVLRVASGVPLVEAERFSPWMYVFTTVLALFLALGKRRGELVLLKENADSHRSSLQDYNLPLLDEMMSIVTASVLVTYAFYTFSAPNLPANHAMMLTIPFVLYGIFRYLYLIHSKGITAAPDEIALSDRPLQVTVILWGLTVVIVMYFLG
ncbi:MAG: decaprenyl-phosphate phosphoribosyltransferase, partial [Anaerolineae bacterium]|nr:decaprenyl-phosphate phosphoribosyltransferase [Anaerolineae bacterium]